MITQREISQVAHREQMSDRVIEKDYVLTWLLFGLASSPLREHLAFKGGTALKKIYFPDYRADSAEIAHLFQCKPHTVPVEAEQG